MALSVGFPRMRKEPGERRDFLPDFVARVAANVLAESSVGFIATDGDPLTNLDNSVAGVDFRYQNTRLRNGKTLESEAWYQQSSTEGLSGEDDAWARGVIAALTPGSPEPTAGEGLGIGDLAGAPGDPAGDPGHPAGAAAEGRPGPGATPGEGSLVRPGPDREAHDRSQGEPW